MKKFEDLKLKDIKRIYHNLSYDELFQHELKNKEGELTQKQIRILKEAELFLCP